MHRARVFVVCCMLALVAFPAISFADTSFTQFLGQLEQQYNLPSGILAKVAKIESGGNATICAATSSACGLFQWTTNSWLSATKALYGSPLSLSMRSDPTESAKVTAFELGEIRTQIGSVIMQANVNMSVGLYLGHFLGSGGAKQLLLADIQNPGESACSLLPKACAANRSILSQSVSNVIKHFAQLMQEPGVVNVNGNFAGSNGVSYAYSSADLSSGDFLPANTPIGVDAQYDYPPVFTSVVSAQPAQTTSMPLSLPNAPQTAPPASYTTPPQAAQALSTAANTATTTNATSTSSCAPQYYCQNDTIYYESGNCAMNVSQICQYGCSGTVCALAPTGTSNSGSTLGTESIDTALSTPELGTLDASSTSFFATSTSIGTSTSLSLSGGLFSVVEEGTPTSIVATDTASAENGEASGTGEFQGQPIESTGFSQNVYIPALVSPFDQALSTLKNTLTGLLTYLHTL